METVDAADIWALMAERMGFYSRVKREPGDPDPYVDIYMSEEDVKAKPPYLSVMMWNMDDAYGSGIWEASYGLENTSVKINIGDPAAGRQLKEFLIQALKASRQRYLDAVNEAEAHMEKINRKLRKFR